MNTLKDIGALLARCMRGEISSQEFAKACEEYLDSPDWRRRKAAQASEDLKQGKAGRIRLLELIEMAEAGGYEVRREYTQMKGGHDSILVYIEGRGSGFPSFFPPSLVEEAFMEFLKGADERRAQRLARTGATTPQQKGGA